MAPQVRERTFTVPQITPLAGVLLDHATIEEGDIGWVQPTTGLFESYNCLTTDRRATWPCPETHLTPPVQAAAATAATGGTIVAGTYRLRVTAFNENGETDQSNERQITTTGTTSTITANWGSVTDADGYRLYVSPVGGGAGSERLVKEVGAVTTTVITVPPAGTVAPPAVNSAETYATKTFENPSWPTGARFAVYAGATCKGFGEATDKEKLKAVFLARESYGVERAVMETVLQGATDLTPASGAVTPVIGIGILEGHAATKYAGVPTIHLPRSLATPLSSNGALETEGGKFYTTIGSKVAAGGGYVVSNIGPTGAAAATGEKWIYASGEVVVRRGKLFTPEHQLDTTTNDQLDLVERIYVVAIDCYKSAIRVKETS